MGFDQRRAASLVTLLSILACAPSNGAIAPTAARPVSGDTGAPGIGDPDFPLDGNGGYDVSHYGLELGYTPSSKHLDGVATIKATTTQALSRFDLDLSGLDVSEVTVNGEKAIFSRNGTEQIGRA